MTRGKFSPWFVQICLKVRRQKGISIPAHLGCGCQTPDLHPLPVHTLLEAQSAQGCASMSFFLSSLNTQKAMNLLPPPICTHKKPPLKSKWDFLPPGLPQCWHVAINCLCWSLIRLLLFCFWQKTSVLWPEQWFFSILGLRQWISCLCFAYFSPTWQLIANGTVQWDR